MGCCGSSLDPHAMALPMLPDTTGRTDGTNPLYKPCGKPPANANVAFRFKVNAPKHVCYHVLTKRKEAKDAKDWGVPGIVVVDEGLPGSPWEAMKDGVYAEAVPHFDIFNWSAETPYMHTWRCTKAKVPIMRGVTGSISLTDGDEPNTSYMHFKAHMHLWVPVCLVRRMLRQKFPKIMKVLVEEPYAAQGDAFYDGPTPPPAATPEQQPGIVPVPVIGKKVGERVAPHS